MIVATRTTPPVTTSPAPAPVPPVDHALAGSPDYQRRGPAST